MVDEFNIEVNVSQHYSANVQVTLIPKSGGRFEMKAINDGAICAQIYSEGDNKAYIYGKLRKKRFSEWFSGAIKTITTGLEGLSKESRKFAGTIIKPKPDGFLDNVVNIFGEGVAIVGSLPYMAVQVIEQKPVKYPFPISPDYFHLDKCQGMIHMLHCLAYYMLIALA